MRSPRGFTLIEVLVTLALVALLASLALPLAERSVQRDKEQALQRALRTLRGAIDDYKQAADEGRIARKADESGYPPSLETLVEGVRDARDPKGAKLYFLRRVPRDPLGEDWGLRSYASPPDDPQPGKDVFDVHSKSEGVGLNGVPYRQW